jgi:hypothetical protein
MTSSSQIQYSVKALGDPPKNNCLYYRISYLRQYLNNGFDSKIGREEIHNRLP